MKIVYITNGICGSGGLERVLSIKCSGFVDNYNYNVHIVSLFENKAEPFYEFNKKIKFHFLGLQGTSGISRLKSTQKKINNLVNDINPDVISVCDDGLKGFFIPLYLKNKKIPLVYERHVSKNIELPKNANTKDKIIAKIKWSLMDVLAKRYNKFVVLTKGNLNEWSSLKNIAVIPNPNTFYLEQSANLKSKKIICVGKISLQKGQDILARIWSNINKEFPEWELHNYGKLDDSFLDSRTLPKNMYLHPPTKDIHEKYLDSSIYLMSSRYEGFGMVLIEAMSLGIPCISFNCNYGPSDIIANKQDGFLIDNFNEEDFTKRLKTLMHNETLRSEMGKLAKQNVKRFDLENILEKWITLFNNLKN